MLEAQPLPGDVEQCGLIVARYDLGDGIQGAAHGAAGAGAEAGQVDGRRVFVDLGDGGRDGAVDDGFGIAMLA